VHTNISPQLYGDAQLSFQYRKLVIEWDGKWSQFPWGGSIVQRNAEGTI